MAAAMSPASSPQQAGAMRQRRSRPVPGADRALVPRKRRKPALNMALSIRVRVACWTSCSVCFRAGRARHRLKAELQRRKPPPNGGTPASTCGSSRPDRPTWPTIHTRRSRDGWRRRKDRSAIRPARRRERPVSANHAYHAAVDRRIPRHALVGNHVPVEGRDDHQHVVAAVAQQLDGPLKRGPLQRRRQVHPLERRLAGGRWPSTACAAGFPRRDRRRRLGPRGPPA